MAGSAVALPPLSSTSTSTAAAVAVAAAAAVDMPTPATPGVWAVSHREVQRAHGGGGVGAGGGTGGSAGAGLAMSAAGSRDERLSGFEVRFSPADVCVCHHPCQVVLIGEGGADCFRFPGLQVRLYAVAFLE